MGLTDRIGRALGFGKTAVGEEKSWFGGGGYNLPISGGWLPEDSPWNFWQQGRDVQYGAGQAAILHACVDAYAQTIATLYGEHYKYNANDVKKRVPNSPLAKVLHSPNGYQTRSDLIMNLVKHLLLHGNGYMVATRDDRGDINSLHNVHSPSTQPYVEPETRAIFYGVGDNPLAPGDLSLMIPQRDVFHVKLYTPRHPLIGVSPVQHAALALAANSAISAHQAAFFQQMSRPSGVLSTDEKLNRDQMLMLRTAWEAQSKKMNSGGIPILSGGLKWQQMSLSSQDGQVAQAFNMTVNDVARAFRIPLPMVQQHDQGSTYNNVEQLVGHWLSGGLGFVLEHLELTFDKFFDLPRGDFTEFDVNTLLRTDFAGKVDGFTKLVTGGLLSPNEARNQFNGLPPVENGDQPIVQQQMVPLGNWNQPEPDTGDDTAPAPEEPPVDQPGDDDPEASKVIAFHAIKRAMK